MKHNTFLILKLLIKFLKELVVGQGLFSAKSPCLKVICEKVKLSNCDFANNIVIMNGHTCKLLKYT